MADVIAIFGSVMSGDEAKERPDKRNGLARLRALS